MWFGSKEQSWVAAELVNLIRFDETQMEFEAWMKITSKLENSLQGWENFNKQTFNFSREHSYLNCSTWSDYTPDVLIFRLFQIFLNSIPPPFFWSIAWCWWGPMNNFYRGRNPIGRSRTHNPSHHPFEVLLGTILPRLWMTLQTRCSRSDAERQRRSWGC